MYSHQAAVERRLHYVRLAIAICLGGGLIIYLLTSSLGAELWQLLVHPDPERFEQWLDARSGWVPLVLIVCMIAHTLVPLPAELLAVAAGMVLGSFWGVVTIWTGALLGAYLGFFLARALGQPLLRRLARHERLQRVQDWIDQADVPLLLAVRLIPVISFNLVNFVLGCTAIGWWRFTWTTALGILPVTVVSVSLGAHWRDWRVVLAFCGAALVVTMTGYAIMRSRTRRREGRSTLQP
ncbi:TVP38/TMEM64 family protein [Candidatus Entotheonella palauensis]|nr:TVP38/TMEM64 family protein [Candidatus Entotheonella palauensis]